MESNNNNSLLSSADEIATILQLARANRWCFSYIVSSERRQTSHTTEIVRVNPEAGIIVVGSEVKYSGLPSNTAVTFRAITGGIDLQFDTELIGVEGNALANRLFNECQLRFPEKIRFSQMRQSVRIGCDDRDEILVSILVNGMRLRGRVADISESGLKICFDGNLSYQCRSLNAVTDSRIRMQDGTSLDTRVQMLGFHYDRHNDVSLLRCRMLEIREDRGFKLRQMISDALSNQLCVSQSSVAVALQ